MFLSMAFLNYLMKNCIIQYTIQLVWEYYNHKNHLSHQFGLNKCPNSTPSINTSWDVGDGQTLPGREYALDQRETQDEIREWFDDFFGAYISTLSVQCTLCCCHSSSEDKMVLSAICSEMLYIEGVIWYLYRKWKSRFNKKQEKIRAWCDVFPSGLEKRNRITR